MRVRSQLVEITDCTYGNSLAIEYSVYDKNVKFDGLAHCNNIYPGIIKYPVMFLCMRESVVIPLYLIINISLV